MTSEETIIKLNDCGTRVPADAAGQWWLPTVGLLLMAAEVAGGRRNGHGQTATQARALLDDVLAAARLGGFARCDILRTRIALGMRDEHTFAMLAAATVAAGRVAIRDILESLSFG